MGQDKFKATSALEGIYTFLIFSAQHETIWPLWKTLNILKTSLYKSSLGVTSSFPVKKSPIWYVTSCTQKMNTACVNHQTYVINLPSDHIKLHKWGHHSWDWIEIHLFCRTIHMFITFLPCTASDQRTFLGSGQPLKKNRLQTTTCTLDYTEPFSKHGTFFMSEVLWSIEIANMETSENCKHTHCTTNETQCCTNQQIQYLK